MSRYLLQARALDGTHYVEIHAVRAGQLLGFQRDALDAALRHLLRASTLDPPDLEDIEVGIAELPFIDDDYEAGGDPGGKLLLPDPERSRTAASGGEA